MTRYYDYEFRPNGTCFRCRHDRKEPERQPDGESKNLVKGAPEPLMATLTTRAERDILAHALGLTRRPRAYRNYYCTRVDDPMLEDLVRKGLMVRGEFGHVGPGRYYHYYHVTDAGKAEVEVWPHCGTDGTEQEPKESDGE